MFHTWLPWVVPRNNFCNSLYRLFIISCLLVPERLDVHVYLGHAALHIVRQLVRCKLPLYSLWGDLVHNLMCFLFFITCSHIAYDINTSLLRVQLKMKCTFSLIPFGVRWKVVFLITKFWIWLSSATVIRKWSVSPRQSRKQWWQKVQPNGLTSGLNDVFISFLLLSNWVHGSWKCA